MGQQGAAYSAGAAIIRMNNQVVGYIKDLSFSENYVRADVKGIGKLRTQEVPLMDMRCSFNASTYVISLNRLGTAKNAFMKARAASSVEEFENTLSLGDQFGISLDIYRKLPAVVNSNGFVTAVTEKPFASIPDAYIETQNWRISENQLVASDVSGRYLTPIFGGYMEDIPDKLKEGGITI
jgi:hypothetical protein